MVTIDFSAGHTAYPVHIGPTDPGKIRESIRPHGFSGLYILSDKNVWSAQGGPFEGFGPHLVLPPGERAKRPAVWAQCMSWLARNGADRESVLVLLGGGVIGDLGGFVAATYMRGIRFVNVATSLLAQIDASLGGKTGIDLPAGKNLVGAFHHPLAVWCDPGHLGTLPDREYRSGMAEAIKYGMILDAEFLCRQEDEAVSLRDRNPDALLGLIRRCCELKAQVVARDPEERTGIRAILNFGHTVGHSLEQALKYEELLHGEAVMIGMIAEAEIGRRMGLTPPAARERLEGAAQFWKLPARLPRPGLVAPILEAMGRDKKAAGGNIAMALLDGLGSCRLVREVDAETVRGVLSEL